MLRLLLLLILTSCSTYKLNIHPETAVYVNKFNYYLKKTHHQEIKNLEIHFSDNLSYNTLAVCVRGGETPLIFINNYYWQSPNYMNDLSREEIVFHELGHCVLNRSHEEKDTSIMYPYHLGTTKYQISHSKYISELFKKEVPVLSESEVLSSTIPLPKYSNQVEEPTWEKEEIREVIGIDIRLIFN